MRCVGDRQPAVGTMLTTRRPRRVPNSTLPAASAKRVSSPPRPTLTPGWKWVPRWRTMISPALTSWPPKRLTPRRWELESRPLRVDEAPFLCAMRRLLLLLGGGVDTRHLDLRQLLTVTLPLAVASLVLVLQDDDLRGLHLDDDLGGDGDTRERLGVAGHVVAVDEEEGGQLDGGSGGTLEAIDLEDVADSDLLL